MDKLKMFKGACLVAATAMLPLSQAAMAEVTISGWINEGIQFYDDGVTSDAVQTSDNGTTLGSRITFAASNEVSTGITAGMEVILEPQSLNTPLIFSNQDGGALTTEHLTDGGTTGGAFGNDVNHNIFVLGASLYVSGAWGKVTVGQQSMPTDNIAVLEDPSLTLWSGISPVFRGNGFTIRGITGASAVSGLLGAAVPGHTTALTWGNFLSCYTDNGLVGGAGIGIDCNGTYQQGVRYDLPAFGPVTIAVGYANDDVFDVNAKWKGDLGRMKGSIALGYADNSDGGASVGATDGSDNFQLQAGLMDPETGLFGSIAYQHEEADGVVQTAAAIASGGVVQDETDAWWLKVGIKKQWFDIGDTSLSFDYGQYEDQYNVFQAALGVTGSEVERIGVAIDQYFGSSLIIYGKWEQLDLDVDISVLSPVTAAEFAGADELDTFTLGAVYFF